MATSFSFQTQIASIMDVLVKAAVTEICKLVDDGSEMLRLEMCRRDNEIEVLNRKLHLVENELWAALKQSSVGSCSVGTQVDDHLVRAENANHADFNAGTVKRHYFQHDHSEAEIVLNAVEELDTLCTTDGFDERRCSGHGVEDGDDVEFLVKAEEEDAVLGRKIIPTVTNVSENHLCMEHAAEESPLQSLFKQENGDVETSDTSCSYVNGQELQALPCPSELLPVQSSEECTGTPLPSLANTYTHVLRTTAVPRDLGGNARSNGFYKAKRARSHGAAPREKWFICAQCGKSFDRFSHLERHQRIHTGEKPYSCATCGKCFSQKSSLKGHQRVHTGERPYSCNMCRKTFSCLSNRNAHQCRHTLVRAYSCYVCGNSYPHLSALKVHQKTHSGERT